MKMLKSILFYPLLWLRPLFKLVGGFLVFVSFLAFLGVLLQKSAPFSEKVAVGAVSLGIFILSFWYDVVLLKLNPHDDIDLTLH